MNPDRQRSFAAATLLFGWLFLGAYGWLLFSRTSFAVGGSDSSGYFNAARMLVRGQLNERVEAFVRYGLDDAYRGAFVPFGFVPGPEPYTIAPLYPAGFPLHVALSATLFGWSQAPFFVSSVAALCSVLLMFLIVRVLGLGRGWALAGAAILALCPFFVFLAIQAMSDVVATAWSLAAILLALQSRRHGGGGWAIAAGLCWGVAFLVRPTSVLLLPALAFALSLNFRRWIRFGIGVVPAVIVFCFYNAAAYGHPLTTGYSGSGFLSYLRPETLPGKGWEYLRLTAQAISPLLAFGWLAVGAARPLPARDRWLLAAWAAFILVFYACYNYDPNTTWWDVRYLLPAIPAMIISSLALSRRLVHGPPSIGVRRAAAAFLFAALVTVVFFEVRELRSRQILNVALDQTRYPRAALWAKSVVPPGSPVVSRTMSGAIKYYTELTPIRWDWFQPDAFTPLRERIEERGDSLYALLFPDEVESVSRYCPGTWTKVGEEMQISLWRLDPDPPHASSLPAPAAPGS